MNQNNISLETVIKGLECRLECGCMNEDHCNPECPYLGDPRACYGLDEDALALLKTQEPMKVDPILFGAHSVKNGCCPKCGDRINDYYNMAFCGRCGQAVKWV